MSLKLTPERLAAVYDMLRAFPPFSRWKLPPAKDVTFRILRTKHFDADWWIEGGKHHIRLSENRAGHMNSVVMNMAHEMIHVHQRIAGTETRGADHNNDFQKVAKRVCRTFGWDPKVF